MITQSDDSWHGVPLRSLNNLAKEIYHGKYVSIDQFGYLVFHYSSRADKMIFHAQMGLDDNGKLESLFHNYYPGQYRDSADDFVDEANRRFTFQ